MTQFRVRTAEVEALSGHHEADPAKHAAQIARELKPAMARLRETGDAMEAVVAADLWPLPTLSDAAVLEVMVETEGRTSSRAQRGTSQRGGRSLVEQGPSRRSG